MFILQVRSHCSINFLFLYWIWNPLIHVSSYYALWCELSWDSLIVSLCVYTLAGDFQQLIQFIDHVTIREFDTQADHIVLAMVNFDVILGMDQLSSHHAILDFFTRTITLAMLGIPLAVSRDFLVG